MGDNDNSGPPFDDPHGRYLDALADDLDPALEALASEDVENALLTTRQREFLLSREEPSSDNRVIRSRIRARLRRGLLDLALLGRLLPPDEFQDTLAGDSSLPDGGHELLRDGLMAGVQFAAEGYDSKHEFERDAANAVYKAFRRRGDHSLVTVGMSIDAQRKDGGWHE